MYSDNDCNCDQCSMLERNASTIRICTWAGAGFFVLCFLLGFVSGEFTVGK